MQETYIINLEMQGTLSLYKYLSIIIICLVEESAQIPLKMLKMTEVSAIWPVEEESLKRDARNERIWMESKWKN